MEGAGASVLVANVKARQGTSRRMLGSGPVLMQEGSLPTCFRYTTAGTKLFSQNVRFGRDGNDWPRL